MNQEGIYPILQIHSFYVKRQVKNEILKDVEITIGTSQ